MAANVENKTYLEKHPILRKLKDIYLIVIGLLILFIGAFYLIDKLEVINLYQFQEFMKPITAFLSVIVWAVLIFCVLYIFRKPLSDLINGIDGIRHKGTEVIIKRISQNKFINNSENPINVDVESLSNEYNSETIKWGKETLDNDLSSNEENNIYHDYCVLLCIERHFLKMSYMIFGFQMKLLFELKRNIDGLNINDLKILFKAYQKEEPEMSAGDDFYEIQDFLFFFKLMEEKSGVYTIGPIGIDFLKYLHLEKLPIDLDY